MPAKEGDDGWHPETGLADYAVAAIAVYDKSHMNHISRLLDDLEGRQTRTKEGPSFRPKFQAAE
jgi:hypothetical protein